jgi:tetraacyldisaccharide 4'-kinase
MENFREIAEEFRAHNALAQVGAPSHLAGAIDELLADRARAAELGRRAAECAQTKRGATDRAIAVIREVTKQASPGFRPNIAAFAIFWPVSRLWRLVGAWSRRRDMRRRHSLAAGVISVGNVTMGGTGKTPLVLYLAEQMRHSGRHPGILSRGYGRHSLEKHLILEPGARVKVTQSGDEPQMFLRSGLAPVGIGIDRFRTGRILEERFGADVMILDDGFQHVRLERQVDIVLVDALTPFGGGEVFPLGRLREPLEALARAHVIVITRHECGRGTFDIEGRLRAYNAHAPIFHARADSKYWVEATSGHETPELPFSRVGAFCGLGNPESFWCTLEQLGIHAVDRVTFGDHHSYRALQMRRVAQQFSTARVEAAVTTEKDAVNLCEGCAELMAPLPLYWLKIGTTIEREDEFLEFIERRLSAKPRVSTASHSDNPTP